MPVIQDEKRELPAIDECVLPIRCDSGDDNTRLVSIDELARAIADTVIAGGEVEMYEYGFGIKFRKAGKGEL